MPIPDPVRSLVVRLFDQLDLGDPGNGDLLFNIFGTGNTITTPNRPFERFSYYEELLQLLKAHDSGRYDTIHKGTAFWFLSWLAFDLRNYPKALFYMDAAISEDFRRAPKQWLTEPAGAFLTLAKPGDLGAGQHVARLRALLDAQLHRFNGSSGQQALKVDDVVVRFVTSLVTQPRQRTVVSAWYVHLLEFQELATDLELRSTAGGSIAPFLDHLFRGGLLLESVLKILYSKSSSGRSLVTLGDIYACPAFKKEFGSGFQTSAADLSDILKSIGTDHISNAFSVAAKLRNTTGHSLIWDDAFTDPQTFRRLFEYEVDAMLFVISRKFL